MEHQTEIIRILVCSEQKNTTFEGSNTDLLLKCERLGLLFKTDGALYFKIIIVFSSMNKVQQNMVYVTLYGLQLYKFNFTYRK